MKSHMRCSGVKNLTSCGVDGTMKNPNKPTILENVPSYKRCQYLNFKVFIGALTRIKIHAQPGLPRTPSIFCIAAASRPEKAPDKDAAEKNNAILKPSKLVFFR